MIIPHSNPIWCFARRIEILIRITKRHGGESHVINEGKESFDCYVVVFRQFLLLFHFWNSNCQDAVLEGCMNISILHICADTECSGTVAGKSLLTEDITMVVLFILRSIALCADGQITSV